MLDPFGDLYEKNDHKNKYIKKCRKKYGYLYPWPMTQKIKKQVKEVKNDIKEFRKDYQNVHYCFHKGFNGYKYRELI
ncbi:hypothetical protein MBGDC06_00713 [Thermoplasmatales archaeon SCGC AB-539-C06]|nr:hypothetical protein MBGDC06_00713 [Thermoplasmatales archaeon SCGC AB-539-C06]